MNILIDAVILQYAAPSSADAIACRAMLEQSVTEVSQSGVAVTVLDRGGGPHIDGTQVIAFPSFRNATPAADAFLTQRLCDRLNIDIFVSTGFTTPISTPTLQLLLGEDLDLLEASRGGAASRLDFDVAVAFSTYLICSTAAMETACRKRFPGLADARIPVSPDEGLPASDGHRGHTGSIASQIVALGGQTLAQGSGVLREPEFLQRWRRVREIQAAIEVS